MRYRILTSSPCLALGVTVAAIGFAALGTYGCDPPHAAPPFAGSVEVSRTGGLVRAITVKFPDDSGDGLVLRDQARTQALLEHLQKMVQDIECVKGQFQPPQTPLKAEREKP